MYPWLLEVEQIEHDRQVIVVLEVQLMMVQQIRSVQHEKRHHSLHDVSPRQEIEIR